MSMLVVSIGITNLFIGANILFLGVVSFCKCYLFLGKSIVVPNNSKVWFPMEFMSIISFF